MSEHDRERCMEEMRRHELEISGLSEALADLDRSLEHAAAAQDEARRKLTGHIAFLNAQVMRHRISIALLQSRLGA